VESLKLKKERRDQ
jgi:hypothetical protein